MVILQVLQVFLFYIVCNVGDFLFCLQTLATSQGNILENKDLIESLNQTKASSALIQEALAESHRLQSSLDQVEKTFSFSIAFFSLLKIAILCIYRLQENKISAILNLSCDVRDAEMQKAFSILKIPLFYMWSISVQLKVCLFELKKFFPKAHWLLLDFYFISFFATGFCKYDWLSRLVCSFLFNESLSTAKM